MEKPPIFIVGCPRSGTTLVRVILDSHPNICCGPETNLFGNIKEFKEKIFLYWPFLKMYEVEEKALDQKLKEIFLLFPENYMRIKKKSRWAEKTPKNIFFLDFIDKLFPECQFINIIRDGRDVVSSYKQRWGRITIFSAIKEWNRSVDLTFEYRIRFSKERYLEIRYDDLVTEPESETKKMMVFLKEEWTPSLLEHHEMKHDFLHSYNKGKNINHKMEKKPLRHTPSQQIFSSSVGNWKNNLNFIEKLIVNLFLQKNLKRLRYK